MMKKWIFINIVLFLPLFSFSQKASSSINKQEIEIGEPFILTYKIVSPQIKTVIHYRPKKKKLVGIKNINKKDTSYFFDLLSPFQDTNYVDSNRFIWIGKYTLTAWDSAYVVLPPDTVKIEDSNYIFPPQLIHVMSPKIIPGKPIYDINDQFTTPPKSNTFIQFLKNNWWWITSIIIVLIIGFILWKKRKKKPLVEEEISLLEKTLQKIQELEDGRGYDKNLKEYYFNLSIILRQFLKEQYQENIMDKTTGEIQIILKKYHLSSEIILTIKQLLQQSDMVKFAQSNPGIIEAQRVTNTARTIVRELVQLEDKRKNTELDE